MVGGFFGDYCVSPNFLVALRLVLWLGCDNIQLKKQPFHKVQVNQDLKLIILLMENINI